jgi:hypothetical protein
MSTQKRKFELFARLQELGFTYDEAASLRRIEMTLQRWAERECGDGSNWTIERDEVTGEPFNVYHGEGKPWRYSIADREAGALRRLAVILARRNQRESDATGSLCGNDYNRAYYYHQGDCRGCMLYICTREQLTEKYGDRAGQILPIDQYYNRGIAVCA